MKECKKCNEIACLDGERYEKGRVSQFKIFIGIIVFIVILVLLGLILGG